VSQTDPPQGEKIGLTGKIAQQYGESMNTIDRFKDVKLLWTSREAAAALSISERTLWKLTNEGNIRCIRIGRSVRYDPADISKWIEAQKCKAQHPENRAEIP
jgi:excisionase family DNA binding protein